MALAAVQCDCTPPPSAASNVSTASDEDSSTVPKVYPIGSMVWGKLPGCDWWPGVIISYCRDKEGDSVEEVGAGGGVLQVWVKWYGENNLSKIPTDKVVLFSNFTEYFNACSLEGIDMYKKGIFMAIKEAARRCKFEFQCRAEMKGKRRLLEGDRRKAEPKSGSRKRRRTGRGESILLTSLEEGMLKWAMNGFPPAGPLGFVPTSARFDSVLEEKIKISDICLACTALDVQTEHPLFEGGLCKECKDIFMECTYLFDDDGIQMYCCVCSVGDKVFMCDAGNCARVYCGNCIGKLCGAQELERVTASSPWLCYMCCPEFHSVGLLTRRHDWDRKLQELFLSDHEMECGPSYPPIDPESRKPIRVLGLFDGIGTGLLVLKELGIEVDTYVASEVDTDAIQVSRARHREIYHVGDISKITRREIQELGPFDLVIGGSPCSDLSIVNPERKGIYEGTGRLFFEFYRIVSYVRCWENGERPLFWLYENVVPMRAQEKHTISRFLQCNPIMVDAKDISATHRARYFWGNIPGMNRAMAPLPGDKLTLQDCLEPNCSRFAQFNKLHTITAKMNSIKQTKAAIYPVLMTPLVDGMKRSDVPKEGDVLWCTEMERLLGFPAHYTDVANLGRSERQWLLGKAWSVPVLRHILSPLKDYFQSSTTCNRKSAGLPMQPPHTTTQ